jgi:hypothetical protein
LRSHREIFLTLLEAFIYDPVVDWTMRNGSEKKTFELNIAIDSLRSRIGEVKSNLNDSSVEISILTSTMRHQILQTSIILAKESILLHQRNKIEEACSKGTDIHIFQSEMERETKRIKTNLIQSVEKRKSLYLKNMSFLDQFNVIFFLI